MSRAVEYLCQETISMASYLSRRESAGVGMSNLQLTQVPIMKTGMLIASNTSTAALRRLPTRTSPKFWFTKGSGRLEAGKQVQWDWEMYGISVR
jgi:hypothetical protein